MTLLYLSRQLTGRKSGRMSCYVKSPTMYSLLLWSIFKFFAYKPHMNPTIIVYGDKDSPTEYFVISGKCYTTSYTALAKQNRGD